jgi:hypothetical protein
LNPTPMPLIRFDELATVLETAVAVMVKRFLWLERNEKVNCR